MSDQGRLAGHLVLAGEAGESGIAWHYVADPKAREHLRAALDVSKEPVTTIQIMARLIRHLGVDRLDVQAAEREYLRADTLAKRNILRGRLKQAFRDATIAIGDAHLRAGQVEKAIEDYQVAEALAEPVIPQQVRSAKIGAYPEHIEQLIRDGSVNDMMEVVQEWYDRLPADMPRGEILFWMGKGESLQGNHAAAIRPLRVSLDRGQGAPFEAEARWLLAEAYRQTGDKESQRNALEMLVRSGLTGMWRTKAIEKLKTPEE